MYSNVNNVRQSLKLAWGYKILWVFALIAVVSSSGGGGGGGSVSSQDSFKNLLNPSPAIEQKYDNDEYFYERNQILDEIDQGVYKPHDSPNYSPPTNSTSPFKQMIEGGEKVLGVATTGNLRTFKPTTIMTKPLESVIPYLIFLIPASILLFLFSVLVALITKSWALGALVEGTRIGIEGGSINLKELSGVGVSSIKKIILFSIFTSIIQFVLVLITLVPSGTSFLFGKPLIGGLLIAPGILLLLIGSFCLNRSRDFGLRYIVFRNSAIIEALKKGFNLVRSAFFRVLGLSILNAIVAGLLSFLLFLPVIILGFILAFGDFFPKMISGGNINSGAIFIFVMIAVTVGLFMVIGMTVLSGYLSTFKSFTWTNLFLHMTEVDSSKNSEIENKDAPENSSALLQGHHNLLKEMKTEGSENGGVNNAI